RLVVLRIVDDPAGGRALVADVVEDVGAELAARDALDGVLAGGRHERVAEVGLDVALLAVAEIVRRLLLERALELHRLLLQALLLPIGLGSDLEQRTIVVDLHRLALAHELRRLCRVPCRHLALVLLTQLAPEPRLARGLAGARLFLQPLMNRRELRARDRVSAERAALIR